MWYFAWILGTALACCLAILNAVWLEIREEQRDVNSPNLPKS